MKRMGAFRLVLAFGVAVLLATPAAASVFTQDFFSTKDNTVCSYSDATYNERDCNLGGLSNNARVAKGSQGAGAFDFDTAAASTWISTNTPVDPTSLTGIQQAIAGGLLKVEFSVCQVGTGYNGISVQVRTIDCAVDWTEGDGTNRYGNYAWSPGTLAATWNNPNQVLPVDGGPLGLGWGLDLTPGNGVGFSNATYKQNSQTMTWGAVSDTYATVPLDAQIVYDLLNTETNRGLYTNGPGSNGYAYMRQYTGTSRDPKLTVTYTEPALIPEPSITFLVFGLSALIRRRRA